MKKRIISLILALVLTVGMIPMLARNVAAVTQCQAACPSFSFTALDGSTVNNQSAAGKTKLIVFARSNGNCINSILSVEALAYADWISHSDLATYVVDVDGSGASVLQQFAADYGNNGKNITFCSAGGNSSLWTFLRAAGYNSYSVTLPVSFVVDENNNIRSWNTGNTTEMIYREMLAPYLSGVKMPLKVNLKIDGGYQYGDAYAVLDIVNKERAARGLPTLKMDKNLLSAAMQRAAECQIYYSHTRPNGESCFTVPGFSPEAGGGENIAIGYSTPAAVMDAWMHSEGHYKNIMTDYVISAGIGVVEHNGVISWVQLFSTQETEAVTERSDTVIRTATVECQEDNLELFAEPEQMYMESGTKQSLRLCVVNGGFGWAYAVLNPESVVYTSQNTNIATVSNGVVTANKSGSTNIKMTLKDGSRSLLVPVEVSAGPLQIITQPKDVAVPSGSTATVTVNATGDGLTYQWYFKNPGASIFYPTDSFKGNSYSITMDASRNGRQVFCVITDKYGNSLETNTVTLKMASLTITKQPANVTVAKGKNASIYVNVAGEGLTFKWYYKNAGDSKFYLTNSFKSNTYSVAMDASRNGRQVYCVITDKYGNTVKTNTVTLKMATLNITKQPVSVTVPKGKTASVYVNVAGSGLTFKWYYKNAGDSKFYLTNSFKSNTYSVTMDASRNGRQVYCVISDKYGNTVKTNTVTLKMATPLAITKQPANVTVAKGATASTTVTATGDGLRYTWYVMDVGAKTWTKSSVTSKTYAFAMTAAKSGRHVYCVVTDAYGNKVTTKSVTLNMKSGVSITTQPVSTTVAKGKTATIKVTASGTGLTYKWYYKNPGDPNFYLTNSFKGNTYSVTMDASRSGRQVYCVISDRNGNTVATSIVSLKMK